MRFSRDRGLIRPGAERLQKLVATVRDQRALELSAILVTGTNGKGSVCAMLESMFRASGLQTGLYTSPHLVMVEERIRINGNPVSAERFSSICAEIERVSHDVLPDMSQFELLTAAAVCLFFDDDVVVPIFEIGLGGHLDSTNALAPVVSVLTSVGLDHTEILGGDLLSIASDKAHIARRNRPIVVGNLCEEALRGVTQTCEKIGATVVAASEKLPRDLWEVAEQAIASDGIWLSANRDNVLTALWTIARWEAEMLQRLDRQRLVEGLKRTFWPGRLDARLVRGVPVLFDAAHNRQGAEFLLSQLRKVAPGKIFSVLLYASLSDKNWAEILPMLAEVSREVVLTEVSNERRVAAETLASALGSEQRRFTELEPDLHRAVEGLFQPGHPGPILITGSIALLGEVMEILALDPLESSSKIESWSELF